MSQRKKKKKAEVLGSQFQRINKTVRITPPSATMKSLPENLIVEVLAKVATSSFTDLFNAKLATKEFLEAAKDGHVYRHVSLQNFPEVPWQTNPKFWRFMENCNKNGNPESLYRKGMLELFSHKKEASGLAYLKASADKGHPEASYVYAIVRYWNSTEGLKFLKSCEAKGLKMAECRRSVKNFVGQIWTFLPNCLRQDAPKTCNCTNNVNRQLTNTRLIYGWDWADEDDIYYDGEHTCEACRWNSEVFRFCNMLKTGRYN